MPHDEHLSKTEVKELSKLQPEVLFEDAITNDTPLTKAVDTTKKEILEQKLAARTDFGEGFRGGVENINLKGRPHKLPQLTKMSNRELRSKELMNLCRKLRPYQTKAVQAIVHILDDPAASDQNKLKAAVFISEFYKGLVKDLYDYRYDEEQGKEIQEDNAPVFSLKMIDPEDNKAN